VAFAGALALGWGLWAPAAARATAEFEDACREAFERVFEHRPETPVGDICGCIAQEGRRREVSDAVFAGAAERLRSDPRVRLDEPGLRDAGWTCLRRNFETPSAAAAVPAAPAEP
jgi:hypothetical protein